MIVPFRTKKVWKSCGEIITAEDLIEDLIKAIKEKDIPGQRLLKGMLTKMGEDKNYPEYFL